MSLLKAPASSLRLVARNNLKVFTEALGYKNAPFHEEWYDILQYKFSPLKQHADWLKKYLLLWPRGHAKTTCTSFNYLSWMIGKYPDIHINLVTKTASLANEILTALMTRFENDKIYRAIFGHIKPRPSKVWSSFEIIRTRKEISKNPTVKATGLMGPITGGRTDLVLCDDIIDEQNVATRLQIEKVSRWFKKVLIPTMYPWGGMIVIGTRWSYADIYKELMEYWSYDIKKAIIDEKQGQVLWPEYWPLEKLQERRKDLGTLFFNCQYQNDPTGMEGTLLKNAWLHTYEELPEGLLIFAGVDPALEEGDLQSIAIIGYARQRKQAYLIDVWADNVPFPQFLKKLRELHAIYKFSKIYVESNSFQKLLIQIPEFVQGMPVVASPSIRGKEQRFITMSSHFEAKRVLISEFLKGHRSEFWNEWVQFPHGQYDDALDATEIAVRNVVTLQPKHAFRFG